MITITVLTKLANFNIEEVHVAFELKNNFKVEIEAKGMNFNLY